VLSGANVFERKNRGRGVQGARKTRRGNQQHEATKRAACPKMSRHSTILGPFGARRQSATKYEQRVTPE
jgi:hypothetical protein